MNHNKLDQTRFWISVAVALLLLLLEIYLYTQNFFMPESGVNTDNNAPLAVVKTLENKVLHKSNGTLLWKNPEVGGDLFQEDAIATMTEGQTTISFADKSELVIEPNSLVILEMAPKMEKQALPTRPKIMLRLVKGSIKRKSKGSSQLLVKLSSKPDEKPVEFDDRAGGAIFRLVHYEWGLQVTVESGKLSVDNDKTLGKGDSEDVVRDAAKLPAPWLKKPSVKIKRRSSQIMPQRSTCWLGFLIPCAYADDEAPLEVTIHFQWEEVKDADSYLIQVSRDDSFSQIVLEKRVRSLTYNYSFPSDYSSNQFYFRVAAISAKNELGKFSDPEMVDVKAGAFRPKIVKKPKKPKPVKKVVKKEPEVEAAPPPEPKGRSRTEVAFGAMYHQRNFKSEKTQPKTAHGSGFVPSNLSLESMHLNAEETSLTTFGVSYLFEVAKPSLVTNESSDSSSEQVTKLATPFWRAWLLFGSPKESKVTQYGPYVSSTSVIKLSGVKFSSQAKILFGALMRYSSSPAAEAGFEWNFDLAVVGGGGVGADVRFSLKRPFSASSAARPIERAGYFWSLEGMTRQVKIESAFGATVGVGRWF